MWIDRFRKMFGRYGKNRSSLKRIDIVGSVNVWETVTADEASREHNRQDDVHRICLYSTRVHFTSPGRVILYSVFNCKGEWMLGNNTAWSSHYFRRARK